jgi:hypothetical protein
MDVLQLTRLSEDKQTEYQIEYIERPHKSEYRMRRGAYGTWTHWFSAEDLQELLQNCGFTGNSKATLLTDYFVESHFGRGVIRLNYGIVLELSACASMNAMCRHLYAHVKQVDYDTWRIPSTAVETVKMFWFLHDVIRRHIK